MIKIFTKNNNHHVRKVFLSVRNSSGCSHNIKERREMSSMRSLFCINVMLAPAWCWQSQSHLRSLELQKHPLLGSTDKHQHQSFLHILNINILYIVEWRLVKVTHCNLIVMSFLSSEQPDRGPPGGWHPT